MGYTEEEVKELQDKINKLEEENKRLREDLKYYIDGYNHVSLKLRGVK